MEMIRLTEEGKQAFRGIKDGTSQDETLMVWADVVASLQDKRIVRRVSRAKSLGGDGSTYRIHCVVGKFLFLY